MMRPVSGTTHAVSLALLVGAISAARAAAPALLADRAAASALYVLAASLFGVAYTSLVSASREGAFAGVDGTLRDAATVALVAPLASLVGLTLPGLDAPLLRGSGGVAFEAGFVVGLLICHLTKPGMLLSGSFVSAGEGGGARVNVGGAAGFAVKIFLIALSFALHVAWCAARGGGELARRLAAYAAVWALIAAVSLARRRSHYLHLHHWALGLLLLPACAVRLPWGPAPERRSEACSLLLAGFCVAQFVEGAARWGCAPLWHPRADAAPPAPAGTGERSQPWPQSQSRPRPRPRSRSAARQRSSSLSTAASRARPRPRATSAAGAR